MDGAARFSLAFDDVGSGQTVVFAHGLTFSRATWEPVIERVSGHFRCIAVDLPGHGESEMGGDATPEAIADALHSTISGLGVDRPVVVGHSAAAVMVTYYAAAYPVAGVVNVDQPLLLRSFGELLQRLEPALRGAGFSDAFDPFRRSTGVEALAEPIRSRVRDTQTIRQEVVLQHWSMPLATPPEELQAWIDNAAERISAPYLAVFGQELSDEARSQLREHIRRLEIEEWPGLGHCVHLADLDRFCERLTAFVAAHGS